MNPESCKSCEFDRSELRRRVLGNQSVQYVYQCLRCGRSASNPIKKAAIKGADQLPPWDSSLAEQYDETRIEERAEEKEAWFVEHNQYLLSIAWKEKRKLVLERSNGLCEGCRKAAAVHVHHLTYEHWKDELLWELVAVCHPCHERAHKRSLPALLFGGW